MKQETTEVIKKEKDGTATKITTTIVTETGVNVDLEKKKLETKVANLTASKEKLISNQDAKIAEATANLKALS